MCISKRDEIIFGIYLIVPNSRNIYRTRHVDFVLRNMAVAYRMTQFL